MNAKGKGTNGVGIVSKGETLSNVGQSYGAAMAEQCGNSIRNTRVDALSYRGCKNNIARSVPLLAKVHMAPPWSVG